MTEFEENPRQGVIVYLYRLRNSRQLRKFGQIQYISKKMKYVVLYMDQADVEGNIERLKKLKFGSVPGFGRDTGLSFRRSIFYLIRKHPIL